MHFVTLTSDWNNDDFYSAALRAAILTSCNNVNFVTISNNIKAHNISEASFILRNSYNHFPKGSIHIIAVSSQPEPEDFYLITKINGHYFITGNNGIISLLGDKSEAKVYRIHTKRESSPTFPALTVFAEAAVAILNGAQINTIGESTSDYKKQIPLRATIENNTITGAVIYIDTYGNAISNISLELFKRIGKQRKFEIYVQSKYNKINKINSFYSETTPGDLLAVFNSVGLLEIAIRNGSAKDLLNLNTDSSIRVEFMEGT